MELQEFFEQNPEVAIAFSGGVDSSYLLYAAKKYAEKVTAYYVNAAFQPQFELEDAGRLAGDVGCEMKIIDADILKEERVAENPADRCYFCKICIFTKILEAAEADGYKILLDGTNASDDAGDRPGMRALKELEVRSPLRECGLTKSRIRELSKEAGLFTWNKPAYACLATRIKTGERITAEKLENIEKAEEELFKMGFRDFRVRTDSGRAKLQIKKDQLDMLMDEREIAVSRLKPYFDEITLDLENVR